MNILDDMGVNNQEIFILEVKFFFTFYRIMHHSESVVVCQQILTMILAFSAIYKPWWNCVSLKIFTWIEKRVNRQLDTLDIHCIPVTL